MCKIRVFRRRNAANSIFPQTMNSHMTDTPGAFAVPLAHGSGVVDGIDGAISHFSLQIVGRNIIVVGRIGPARQARRKAGAPVRIWEAKDTGRDCDDASSVEIHI